MLFTSVTFYVYILKITDRLKMSELPEFGHFTNIFVGQNRKNNLFR